MFLGALTGRNRFCNTLVNRRNIHMKLAIIASKLEELRTLLHIRYAPESIDRDRLYQHARQIKKYFAVEKIIGNGRHRFIRFRRENGRNHVMYNDLERGDIVYSFGHLQDRFWEYSLRKRGIKVFHYRYTEAAFLLELLKKNGHIHAQKLILCLDLCGDEWDILGQLNHDILNQFRQIGVVYHSLDNLTRTNRISKTLNRIDTTHQLVYMEAGKECRIYKLYDIIFPAEVDAVYLNRSCYVGKV